VADRRSAAAAAMLRERPKAETGAGAGDVPKTKVNVELAPGM
jgi:hypothetical protein